MNDFDDDAFKEAKKYMLIVGVYMAGAFIGGALLISLAKAL